MGVVAELDLSDLRHLLDFGLVVLIWLVQLVIYPSFVYTDKSQLVGWHRRYTQYMGMIAGSLMIGQMVVVVLQCLTDRGVAVWCSAVLVFAVWVLTFCFFVPTHQRIDNGAVEDALLQRLVHVNWWRTVLWSVLFLVGWF